MAPRRTFHVVVSDVQPNGWTFATESDHVFYPGTISFSVFEVGGGEIELRIDLKGTTNGIMGTLGFFLGGEGLGRTHVEPFGTASEEENMWQVGTLGNS